VEKGLVAGASHSKLLLCQHDNGTVEITTDSGTRWVAYILRALASNPRTSPETDHWFTLSK